MINTVNRNDLLRAIAVKPINIQTFGEKTLFSLLYQTRFCIFFFLFLLLFKQVQFVKIEEKQDVLSNPFSGSNLIRF